MLRQKLLQQVARKAMSVGEYNDDRRIQKTVNRTCQ